MFSLKTLLRDEQKISRRLHCNGVLCSRMTDDIDDFSLFIAISDSSAGFWCSWYPSYRQRCQYTCVRTQHRIPQLCTDCRYA